MTEDDVGAHSIQLRLRRTVVQDVYVSIPVTSLVMDLSDPTQPRLDVAKVMALGVRLGDLSDDWQVESMETEPHPVQVQRPEGREAPSWHGDPRAEELARRL